MFLWQSLHCALVRGETLSTVEFKSLGINVDGLYFTYYSQDQNCNIKYPQVISLFPENLFPPCFVFPKLH